MPFSFLYCSLWQLFGNVNWMLYLFFLKQEMLATQPEVRRLHRVKCWITRLSHPDYSVFLYLQSVKYHLPCILQGGAIEQHFLCPCRVLLVPTAPVYVRAGAKRVYLGKGERKSYCLSKYLCECRMEMNPETEGVFIQQILAGFVSYLWKTCTPGELLALKWNECNPCSILSSDLPQLLR